MKKGLAIVNNFITYPQVSYFYSRMKEELVFFDVTLDLKKSGDLKEGIGVNCSLLKKDNYDFILYLDKDPYIADALEKEGYRLFNKSSSIAICDDKMKTYLALKNKGINFPYTESAPLNYTEIIDKDYLKIISTNMGFPLIIKTNYGSLGKGVFLIKDSEELEKMEQKLIHVPHIFQKFINSSFGQDFRIITIGGKYVAGMKRISKNGDFRSNIALGGEAQIIPIENPYIEMAEKVSQLLELDYAGIDILIGNNNEPIFCEANSNAFFQGIEKYSGVNIAREYAKHIFNKIYK